MEKMNNFDNDWIRDDPGSDRIMVKLGKKYHLISKQEIQYVESEGNYARLHCAEKSFLVKRTLLFLENRLGPHRFIRINRAVLVNIDLITEMEESEKSNYRVRLRNDRSFQWSRRYRERLTRLMRI